MVQCLRRTLILIFSTIKYPTTRCFGILTSNIFVTGIHTIISLTENTEFHVTADSFYKQMFSIFFTWYCSVVIADLVTCPVILEEILNDINAAFLGIQNNYDKCIR